MGRRNYFLLGTSYNVENEENLAGVLFMNAVTGRTRGFLSIQLVLAALAVMIAASGVLFAGWFLDVLDYDRVYPGVHVEGLDVGDMYPDEIKDLLMSEFEVPVSKNRISLKSRIGNMSFTLADVEFSYDLEKAVDTAYSIGRKGNLIQQLLDMLIARTNTINIRLESSFSTDTLKTLIKDFYNETLKEVMEPVIDIEDYTLTVYTGHHGENISLEKTIELATDAAGTRKNTVLEIPVQVTRPTPIDIDKLLSLIVTQPEDAVVTVTDNSSIVIEPHEYGRTVSEEKLTEFIHNAQKYEDGIHTLQLDRVEPGLTEQEAYEKVFRDRLASYSTWFSTKTENDSNRAENIRLASSAIDNLILAPDEVFSFNEVVGRRTAEGGYLEAHIYLPDRVEDGIGGGICQVSSTLYVTSLYAGLETIERWNHVFTVGYVPLGQDATVSYGTADFKFRNSTEWPIRIETDIVNNNLVFQLYGTEKNTRRNLEFVPEIIKEIPYETRYVDDPDLPEGEEEIEWKGKNGYIVDTYRIVKDQSGTILESEKIHTSIYRPLTEEIRVGTADNEDSEQYEPIQPSGL